ncbi:MAG: hypothetical protein ACYTGC_09835 [Planctomycetota bacterium]
MAAAWADDGAVKSARARANQWTYGQGAENLQVWFRDGRVWNIIDNRVDAP